jgi:hypothetical protein
MIKRALKVVLAAAVAIAAAPVTLVAAGAWAAGWWRGWPPRRLYLAAAWCLPMVGAWLIAVAVWHPPFGTGPGWLRVLAAPYRAWTTMWTLLRHGHILRAAVMIAPPAIPLGLLAGGAAWAYRIFRMETGAGGLSPAAPARFDARLWRRQVRAARALLAAPGAAPLFHHGAVTIGATIRSRGHRAGPIAAIPYPRLRSHQVVIGTTGTGKTTLLIRLWAGFMAGGMHGYAAGAARRPLLVVLDCKGGASSRKVADRFRRVLRDAGATSVATWPDESALRLWDLPPGQLVSTLLDLIEHGTGAAAYYADLMESLVTLAVEAPCGPPSSAADFLSRLDAAWLRNAYSGADAEVIAAIRDVGGSISDTALRFRTLWRRLGAGFDGNGGFADCDAWYCVLEGTAERAVAEAQARALTDLLAHCAVSGADREILLAVDEFSAVSRRLPIWQLYERARSLGLAVQVSAQSWQGLADDEDERYRIATTAEGGIWLLRTPHPGPVVELAGTREVVDTARRLAGDPGWDATGSSRVRQVPVLNADLVRRLDVGQVAYVYRGGATFIQVKRLIGTQAAIAAPPAPPRPPAPPPAVPAPRQAMRAPAGLREFLDETFGPADRPDRGR